MQVYLSLKKTHGCRCSREGAPVIILNRNGPVFYAVPAQAYELMIDKLDDIELASIVKSRLEQAEIEVDINDF